MVYAECIKHELEQIESIKNMGVPELMRKACRGIDTENSIAKLESIADSLSFAEPEYNICFADLKLSSEDDAAALLFHIWANPKLEEGDAEYFDDCGDAFTAFMKKHGGEIGRIAASIVDDVAEYLSCNTITIEQLLGLKEIFTGRDN